MATKPKFGQGKVINCRWTIEKRALLALLAALKDAATAADTEPVSLWSSPKGAVGVTGPNIRGLLRLDQHETLSAPTTGKFLWIKIKDFRAVLDKLTALAELNTVTFIMTTDYNGQKLSFSYESTTVTIVLSPGTI